MWEGMFASFRPGLLSGEADLARAEAELGVGLPASYRAFCRECGAGRVGDHLRIMTPGPVEAVDLVARAHLIAHSVAVAIDGLSGGNEPHRFTVEGDADAALMERALFFGETDAGAFLFWDVTPGFPEYDVWVLCADLESVHFAGADLRAFVTAARSLDVLHIFGEGVAPLPSTFEGDDRAVLERIGGGT